MVVGIVARVAVGVASLVGLVSLGALRTPTLAQSNSLEALAAQTTRSAYYHTRARLSDDEAAFRNYRPAFPFWQHIFTIPDGSIIYGSAKDGRLLATFPTRGNWARDGIWEDAGLAGILEGPRLSRRLRDRRGQLEDLLERAVGPVVHNTPRIPEERRRAKNLGRRGSHTSSRAVLFPFSSLPCTSGSRTRNTGASAVS